MTVFLTTVNFNRGLQDTHIEDALGFPGWSKFHDVRVSEGGAKRRKGIARLARSGTNIKSLTHNGINRLTSYPVDARVITLMGTKFTLEGLIDPNAVATTAIWEYGSTTLSFSIDTSSSKLRVRIWDSAASLTTLTSTDNVPTSAVSFQIVRDGATLTLRIDGVEDTGAAKTMHATNALRTPVGSVRMGYDGSNYFDGEFDYFRIFSVARTNHNDDRLRFPDPRASYVLYDADFKATAELHIIDRSRFGNTGLHSGSASQATALAHQTSPVTLIHHTETRSGEGKLVTIAGRNIYAGQV